MRQRRATPRIWDTDWLVLRVLNGELRSQAKAHVAPRSLVVDLGCGDMPYAELMRQLDLDYLGADIGGEGTLLIDREGRVPLGAGVAGAVLSNSSLWSTSTISMLIAPESGAFFTATASYCCRRTAHGFIILIRRITVAGRGPD